MERPKDEWVMIGRTFVDRGHGFGHTIQGIAGNWDHWPDDKEILEAKRAYPCQTYTMFVKTAKQLDE